MEVSRFDDQLLPGEHVLWHGQPNKEAFARDERRLVNWVIGFNVAWVTFYEILSISKHGIPYTLSHQVIVILVLDLALLLKGVTMFGPSDAGDYWYAVTNLCSA